MRGRAVVNVKWAMALLQFAVWVQLKLSSRWVREGKLAPSSLLNVDACPQLKSLMGQDLSADMVPNLVMAIVGAAGTGKTTVLRILQPFGDFFLADESMKKSAPTNTASRVGGGDTCHALYKLPFGSLKGKGGCLSGAVLQDFKRSQLQKEWEQSSSQLT